jgi:hypothetical protein
MDPAAPVASSAASLTDGLANEAFLTARLHVVAEELRRRARPQAAIVFRWERYALTDEFHVLALSSAFLAFTTMGGDVDHPEHFDWVGQHAGLVTVGLAFLRSDLRGPGSTFNEEELRRAERRDGAIVDALAWSAWGGERPPQRTPPPAVLSEMESVAIRLELEAHLTAHEYRFVRGYYLEGRSQPEMAAEVVAQEPKYQTSGGQKRAELMVTRTLFRARQRLKRVLGDRWQAVAEDLV